MSNKKAVGYLRISSLRQVNNESIETQKQTIQTYADNNGIDIVKWYNDEAVSAKNTDRTELKNLIKYVQAHKGTIDYVVVYKMNRASRDMGSYSELRLLLLKYGTQMRSATEPVDDSPIGRFMENIFVANGQLDNEIKGEVTRDNMRSLAMQGYWQHHPLLGYDSTKIENELGKKRPTMKFNSNAEKIKKVLERYSIGDISKAELCRFAKEIGLRSRNGRVLTDEDIDRLIKHPVYAGYVIDKLTDYQLVAGKHPAIISVETYEKNQNLLKGKRARKGEAHDSKNKDYPLRGLLLCSNCNKPLYSSAPKTGNGGSSPRYHCARKSCVGKVPSVRSKILHDKFEDLLKKLKPSDEMLKLYKHVLIKEANASLDNLNLRITNTRRALDDISEKRSKAITKFIEGIINEREKDDYTNSLDEQKMDKSAELEKLLSQQQIRESDIEAAINVMEKVDKQWATQEYDIQQRFQSMLFPRGLVYDSKLGKFGTSEISPLYRVIGIEKGSIEPSKSNLVALIRSDWNLLLEELLRWRVLLLLIQQRC